MLYQVEQRGRQTAFVGEDGAGLVGLYPLLARAAAIAENENSSFAEALSLAAAERGTPLRRVFADEAEALSHDLGHGGAAEQRAVIDLDNGRIRLEYDHRAGSLRESLDALANHFPTAGANRIQNRLIAFLAEHDGSEELYKTLHNELGLTRLRPWASISPTAMSLTAMTHTRTSWTTFALSRKPRRCSPGLSPAMRCLPRKRPCGRSLAG